ncbi:MAG: hypothetical protein IT273_01990 [Chitinophagales bacterium]|jgi:hypothetical protein|nr:hypothetical protein [Chitinophagales bacterium]
MFKPILAIENPFVQLMDTIHSPLFWLMVLAFTVLMGYLYLRFVRNNNNMSEEELYLAAVLEKNSYMLLAAQREQQAGPFSNMPPDPETAGVTHSVYWRITAQNGQNRDIEFWAKILYARHRILTVKWSPDPQNPNVYL